MKQLFFVVIFVIVTTPIIAQQNFNSNLSTNYENRIGLVGLGSLNAEEFEKVNASGKFAGYAVPFLVEIKSRSRYVRKKVDDNNVKLGRSGKHSMGETLVPRKRRWYFKNTAYVAYNINATNTDSILPSTVLFPELGSASFIGTIENGFITYLKNDTNDSGIPKTVYGISLLMEFASKNINITNRNVANTADTNLFFNILHYSIGTKFIATSHVKIDDKSIPVSLAVTPYIHWMNIPNEDEGAFQYTFSENKQQPDILPSFLFGTGAKVVFSVNHFQFFADYRQVFDSKEVKIPDESNLKGFTSNIGFAVSAEILEFK